MPQGQRRADLQALAEGKLNDATLLLTNGRFGNAYYLAGYAVELGLKACIAKRITGQSIPDLSFIKAIYQHNLKNLVGVAGLSLELREEEKADAAFATYWGIAGEWKPESRYDATDSYTAQLLVQSVGDTASGILRWIRMHW